MLRLFVAVTLPEEALRGCELQRRRLEETLGSAARAVRFSRAEGLHFTLKFLGWAPEDSVEAVQGALALAAAESPAFTVALRGLEAFPTPRRPRVLYLGVSEGRAPMEHLAQRVEAHVAPLGFPAEERRFTPHVTLGRVREPRQALRVGERLAGLAVPELARFDVTDVALMRSELQPGGSRYTALARLPLQARP